MPTGMQVYLADAETGIIQNLEDIPVYRLELSKGSYTNRFYLLFSKEDHVAIPGTDPLIMFQKGNSLFITLAEEKGELLISNTLGQVIKREDLSGKGMHEIAIGSTATGIYIVSLSTARGRKSGKMVVAGQ
jgi:fibronectin-binding autotransporter adhesin